MVSNNKYLRNDVNFFPFIFILLSIKYSNDIGIIYEGKKMTQIKIENFKKNCKRFNDFY